MITLDNLFGAVKFCFPTTNTMYLLPPNSNTGIGKPTEGELETSVGYLGEKRNPDAKQQDLERFHSEAIYRRGN